MTPIRMAVIGVMMEICYLSFYIVKSSPGEVLLFLVVGLLTFGLCAYAVYLLLASGRLVTSGNQLLMMIIGFAVLFRLTLVPHIPVASDDVYRYVWDGKVAATGVNPFAFAPSDARLSHLHTADLPAKISFPDMRTIYPPLAQVFFLASHQMFGDSVSGMKLLLVLIDIVSLLVLIPLLRRLGLLPEMVLVYAWSPLSVMYFALDGHIDALGILFLVLCIFLASTSRHIAAAVTLGLAGLAKVYPLLVAPFLMKGGEGQRRLWAPAIPVVMFVFGCWLYLEPTGGLYESLFVFSRQWSFNGSVFEILYLVVGSNTLAHLISGILLIFWLGCVLMIKRPFIEKTFLAFLGFVIVAPVVHPWYLCWLTALLVVRWSLPVFVLLGLSFISNLVVYQYRMTGVWEDQPLVVLAEYLPFYVMLVREIVRGTFSSSQGRLSIP